MPVVLSLRDAPKPILSKPNGGDKQSFWGTRPLPTSNGTGSRPR